jgi:hypothetical protein
MRERLRRTRRAGALAVLALLCLLAPAGAQAKTFVVTQTDDLQPPACTKSACTLRGAVSAANARPGLDTVRLRSGQTYELTGSGFEDSNGTGDLDIAGPTIIRPQGKRLATIDAGGDDRAVDVLAGSDTVKLRRLKLTGGSTFGDQGAGLRVQSGTAKTSRVRVVDNSSSSAGGGVWVAAGARATIVRSTIGSNSSQGIGGGIGAFGAAVVRHSTISHNFTGNFGGGVAVGSDPPARLRATDSTIADNVAFQDSGGIYGGVFTRLNGVTVAGNEANTQGSINDGGGIVAPFGQGTFVVANSIIADNVVDAGGNEPDCSGVFTSSGGNLVEDLGRPSACQGFGSGDITGEDPALSPLAHNGGAARTMALQSGSPAVGAAVAGTAPQTDERYVQRDASPDSGAFEAP